MKRLPLPLLFLACSLLASFPALADVTAGDMQIMARALGFMTRPLTGDVKVAVVYSPGNAQSTSEAESVQRMLAGGLRVGSVTLRAVVVPLGDLQSVRAPLLFLTAGLSAQARAVAAVSRARQIPCVTTDLTQVTAGVCAIGIRSQPRVEILVNHTTAAAEGTAFSTVFSLMITEF